MKNVLKKIGVSALCVGAFGLISCDKPKDVKEDSVKIHEAVYTAVGTMDGTLTPGFIVDYEAYDKEGIDILNFYIDGAPASQVIPIYLKGQNCGDVQEFDRGVRTVVYGNELEPGTHTLTARLSDCKGDIIENDYELTVKAPPADFIEIYNIDFMKAKKWRSEKPVEEPYNFILDMEAYDNEGWQAIDFYLDDEHIDSLVRITFAPETPKQCAFFKDIEKKEYRIGRFDAGGDFSKKNHELKVIMEDCQGDKIEKKYDFKFEVKK